MKTFLVAAVSVVLLSLGGSGVADETTGKGLFKEHCAVCHPNGGNIIRPEKTLLKENLDRHGIKSTGDIVHIMRNPGRGMKAFSKEKLPDAEAEKIAEYILETFR